MKSKTRFFVILCVGSCVFLALTWLTFDVGLTRALAGAIITMTCVAVLDYLAPREKMYQFTIAAIVGGTIIGIGLWWTLPYLIPWYFYAIPSALVACVEALMEHWSDRFRKT